jgi:hypothetical protein
MADLERILQQLHDSEINAGVQTFYDAGMRVWIGDEGLVTLLKEERKKAACRKSSSDRRTPGVHRRGAEAAVRRR